MSTTSPTNRSSFSSTDTRTYIPRVEVERMLYNQFKDLSDVFQRCVLQDHLNILHKFLHDHLTYEDLLCSMEKYGVDLEKAYFKMLDMEDEDEDAEEGSGSF